MVSIRIIVPVLGQTEPGNSKSLIEAVRELDKQGHNVTFEFHKGESLISRARCVIAHKFLQSDDEWLMCIDSDILFDTDAIPKLLNSGHKIIGGNYRHKTEAVKFAGYPKSFIDNISECTYLPTGFMLVHRSVFEDLIKHKYNNPEFNLDFFNTTESDNVWGFYVPYIDGRHVYLSEDWAFTKRLEQAGIPSYMDNTITLMHIGTKVY